VQKHQGQPVGQLAGGETQLAFAVLQGIQQSG